MRDPLKDLDLTGMHPESAETVRLLRRRPSYLRKLFHGPRRDTMSELVTIGKAGNKRMVLYTGPETLELEVHVVSPGIHAVINLGQQPVVIEKLYGPASFRPVRVTPVVGSTWEWVVEQLVSDHPRGLEDHWQEVARFDCIHDDDKSECPED